MTVTRNGTLIATINKTSGNYPSSTVNTTVTNGDTIVINATANTPTGAGCASYFGTDITVQTANNLFSYTNREFIGGQYPVPAKTFALTARPYVLYTTASY